MSVNKVLILRGISGSGKSTWARKFDQEHPREVLIVSADDYFIQFGEYRFEATQLTRAHSSCLSKYMEALADPEEVCDVLIVDNTNTQLWELSPYVALAQLHDTMFEVVEITCSPLVAASRTTHGVSEEQIQKQHDRFEPALPWWPSIYMKGD